MGRTRVKICGLTRAEDARLAGEAGADAIGLVFCATSRRNVTIERAREILTALPPWVTPVALFVNAPVREILDTVDRLHIRHVQLHGRESVEYLAPMQHLRVIKALAASSELDGDLRTWLRAGERWGCLCGLLLDTPPQPGDETTGGSGRANNWEIVKEAVRDSKAGGLPVIAAGGLCPQTVGDVIRRVRPWGVDVSSGVEGVGGKDPQRIKRFIDAVSAADADSCD